MRRGNVQLDQSLRLSRESGKGTGAGHNVETRKVTRLFGITMRYESPNTFPFDDVGSPTKTAVVNFIISVTSICAAENVRRPAIT